MEDRAAIFRERAREQHGVEVDTHEFPEGTETAAEAAEAIGCETAEIASSIVLVADEMFVVIMSGAERVDTRAAATLRGVHEARLAEPDEIEETIGWPVGAVPPFSHDTEVPVYVDESVMEHDTVWASGGARNAVFPIDPERLVECADATVADLAE